MTRALICGRKSKNRKGAGKMFERNITEVDSTSPGYHLDVGLERRKKSETISCNSKS